MIAWLPRGVELEELARLGMAVGLMSAGMGEVPAEQTYLDVGQGNRVFDSLYDEDLPPPGGDPEARRRAIEERAASAPADIEPGLLAATAAAAGKRLETRQVGLAGLRRLLARRGPEGLVIAIERPPPASGGQLAIGAAGPGLRGNLTSDSTRTEGYVLSTDVAPTVLVRLGVAVPAAMTGEPIRAEGEADPEAIEDRGARMAAIPDRRGPVIGVSLLVWIAALALVALLRRRALPAATRLVGLSVVYLPLLLLIGAALEPGEAVERLLVAAAAPSLAAATLRAAPGLRALGAASAAVVLAHAVDVVAGSPLTKLSLLGPNPGLGVRFYGIGNELEAVLAVLVVAGAGALLAGFAPRLRPARAAAFFLAAGLGAAAVFAAGRFGADVGAAIVLPFGAAVAAAAIAARRRATALLAVAAPVAALAVLAAVDLVSGGDAHLTRSVLEAGGLDEAAEVAQRRLELSAHSFARPVVFIFMPLVIAAALAAFLGRRRIAAWLAEAPAMRAGLAGALAAVLLGALANDSGALLLEIGAAYLLVFVGYAWAEARPS